MSEIIKFWWDGKPYRMTKPEMEKFIADNPVSEDKTVAALKKQVKEMNARIESIESKSKPGK